MRRVKADFEKLKARVIEAKKKDPELSPLQLGARFGISHVTARRLLREAGLYAAPVSRRKGPPCGHSTCSQVYIDTGKLRDARIVDGGGEEAVKRDPLPTAPPPVAQRAHARRVDVGNRSAIVAPMRYGAGWVVSLDGFCVDSIHSTADDAEATARRLLEDPDCPCWIAVRAS